MKQKRDKYKGVPEWLEDLIIETADICIRKGGLEEYCKLIHLKSSICGVCSKETYEIERQNGDLRCINCKTIKKNELF